MADDRLILVYDGECGFCARLARWVEERDRGDRIDARPNQEQGLMTRLNLSREEVGRASWVVDASGRKFEGAAGINRVLRELGGAWGVVAAVYQIPPIRWIENAYYRRVARRRAWW